MLDEIVDKSKGIIKLCEDGYCPCLDNKGFCKIVLDYGEENISDTCHTFPREKHEFNDRTEYTLAMGCPEAVRLLFAEKDVLVSETEEASEKGNISGKKFPEEYAGYTELLFEIRRKFLEISSNNKYSTSDTLKMLFYIMLEWFDRDCDEELDINTVNLDITDTFLDELHSSVNVSSVLWMDTFGERNELFLDLVENYRKKKKYADILEPLCEYANTYEESKNIPDIEAYKEFQTFAEDKMKLLAKEELYSTLVLSQSDTYTLALKLEWIGLTISVIEHCLFMVWLNNERELPENKQVEIIVLVMRMTGYSEADIEEYLEEGFESAIWDWGYMALIMGNI